MHLKIYKLRGTNFCPVVNCVLVQFKHQVFEYLLDAQHQASGIANIQQHMILASLMKVYAMVEIGDRKGLNEVRIKNWTFKKARLGIWLKGKGVVTFYNEQSEKE